MEWTVDDPWLVSVIQVGKQDLRLWASWELCSEWWRVCLCRIFTGGRGMEYGRTASNSLHSINSSSSVSEYNWRVAVAIMWLCVNEIMLQLLADRFHISQAAVLEPMKTFIHLMEQTKRSTISRNCLANGTQDVVAVGPLQNFDSDWLRGWRGQRHRGKATLPSQSSHRLCIMYSVLFCIT